MVTSKLFLKMIFDPQDVELKRPIFFKLLLISKMYKNKGFRFLIIFLAIFQLRGRRKESPIKSLSGILLSLFLFHLAGKRLFVI